MGRKSTAPRQAGCPCGQPRSYDACCGIHHRGEPAPTPEALMRSRYTAYVLGLEDYLLATWAPETRPASLDLASEEPHPQWLGLELRRAPPALGDQGQVEFVARYKLGGRAHRLHELSRFCRREGRWYYLDGEFPGAA